MGGAVSKPKGEPMKICGTVEQDPMKPSIDVLNSALETPCLMLTSKKYKASVKASQKRRSLADRRGTLSDQAYERFRALDKDGSGKIEEEEIKLFVKWVLENTGLDSVDMCEKDIENFQKRMLDIFDMDGDKSLGFLEFQELYDEAVIRIKLVAACEDKFKEIDRSQDGYIEGEEIVVLSNWILEAYNQLNCDQEIREKILESVMSKFDRNGDGKMNKYEFSLLFEDVCHTHVLIAKAKEAFVDLDKDNNGYLEGSEIDDLAEAVFKYYRPEGNQISDAEKAQMKHKIMQRCDGNHNGFLFAKDVAAMLSDIVEERSIKEAGRAKFMELDTDFSGYLDLAEVEQVAEWVINTFCLFENKDDVIARLLADVDKDGDGKLGLDEFTTLFCSVISRSKLMKQAGKTFLTLDTDLDGYLKGSELDKMVTWVLNFYQPDGASHLTVDQKIIYKNELMSMIDKDTNGKISLDEFSTLFEQLRKDKARDRKSKGELFPFQ